VYGEATIGSSGYNTGLLTVSLFVPPAEAFSDDVILRLDVSSGQSNIALATNSVTVSMSNTNQVDVKFSVLDGTVASAVSDITITATVTNEASSYFTKAGSTTINVTNIPPAITRPDAADIAKFASIPQNRPYIFTYAVSDVNADTGSTMTVTWDFDDGSDPVTVSGTGGRISHTFASSGAKSIRITATDKDGGSTTLIVPATVLSMPDDPTVTIVPPADALSELNGTAKIGIKLSETFTNEVTVDLTFSPVTNGVNGAIKLSTNRVVFSANEVYATLGVPYREVTVTALDGTSVSLEPGFEIIPKVSATPAATNYFKSMVSGFVKVNNVSPVIQVSPLPSDLTTGYVVVAQGSEFEFSWTVTDDSAVDLASMRVVWSFGDGTNQTVYGAMGTVSHIYKSVGDLVVRATAYDKDGASSYQTFKIQVQPSKEVLVTPIGPSTTSYYGAKGTGYGTISSSDARSPVTMLGSVYDFIYDPTDASATLVATPYKFAGYDSFFFVWMGADQGLSDAKQNPYTVAQTWYTNAAAPDSAVASVALAQSSTNSVSREISAIFSREYLTTDNMGDINQDGIPDMIAFQMEQSGNVDIGDSTPGMMSLKTLNTDLDTPGGTAVGDYLPVNPTGSGGRFDFRPVAAATGGNDFTTYLEVRGYDSALNMVIGAVKVSDSVDPKDEPGTDPLLADTDGDGFLDGWEYYFYYNAKFQGMTGSKYDPANVSQGALLRSKDIYTAFEPSVAATEGSNVRDTDGDGVLDIEEMAIGTNPVNWDTDVDGICDSWEILRGLDPCYADDGLVDTESNPDGDYMAYGQTRRQFVTLSVGTSTNITCLVVTNITLNPGDMIGTAVTGTLYNANGNVTTWYTYGDSNALIAVGCPLTVPANATVLTRVNVPALVLHYQVLREYGFDPRTAWFHTVNVSPDFDRFPAWINNAANTKPFTALDEYLLLKFMSENRMNGATATMPATASTFKRFTTDPLTPDSDVTKNNQDGMPDGWELYVSVNPAVDLSDPANRVMTISPWNALDGDLDVEPATVINQIVPIEAKDGLINRREFGGTDSSACYTNTALYGTSNFLGVASITRPSVDASWLNKFWPSNPWSQDTDGDGLNDLAERTFVYGTVTDNQTPCIQGGGLNPDSVDTDLDALPDAWEFEFTGTMPTAGTFGGSVTPVIVITNGMDGTVSDYDQDWDSDGLKNYQEYWTQAVRSFRYDITDVGTVNIFGKPGQPIDDTFAPASLFTEVKDMWDQARYPWGDANSYLSVMLPLVNMYDKDNAPVLYASTDPRNFDSDGDGMDDYYEMYHGLNPLLGDPVNDNNVFVVNADLVARACIVRGVALIDYNLNEWDTANMLLLDFVKYPWMTGLPEADPDSDGLRNSEEQLQPNTPQPSYSHTDPTPMWMTDESNTNSLTARFYHTMGYSLFKSKTYDESNSMFYWPPLPVVPPDSVFTYERNEGYDTDNDGISDKAELINSKNKLSDPLDSDDPIRRQALWFAGTNSAASVAKSYALGTWSLRSFTVELWARPEEVNREQVLLERAYAYSPSDLSTTNKVVRRNFRIGIAADGRVYGSFDNAGAHDDHTATVKAYGNVLKTNEWVHIAARMDGSASAFSLLVNGVVADTVPTTLVPANGVIIVASTEGYPDADPSATLIAGGVVIGAANNRPDEVKSQAWADYANFYKGFIDEVRIWDGARSDDEVWSNYKKRFSKSELWNNRWEVQTQIASGYTRVWGNSLQLMAELLSDYNFDNLFGADVETSVATSPRGFESGAVTINQPADAAVRWWADSEVKSTVYTDYKYLPRIEDSVAHMPIFGFATNAGSTVMVVMSNSVADSVYWTHTAAGKVAGVYNFPNSANPYNTTSDLIPLGGAFAKQVNELWDGNGASGVWLETVSDSDSDGLPDWWELYISGTTTGADWSTVNASGKTNGEQYQRDIANGMTASNNPLRNPTGWKAPDSNGDRVAEETNPVVKQTSDLDGDGMPDWWENIFGLDPGSAEGSNGALGDPDKDGLSNLAEYMISDVYKLRYLSPIKIKTNATQKFTDYFQPQGSLTLGAMFSDHDFVEDLWESQYGATYASPYLYDPTGDADQDGWSNWAECRYSAAHRTVRPDLTMETDPIGNMVYSFPVPIIQTTLQYDGLQSAKGGNVVIQVYSQPDMNGTPNATYTITTDSTKVTTKTQPVGYWSDRTVSDTLSPGSIQPGTIGLKFTDLWTGLSLTTGFDSQGVVYYGTVGGASGPIGTIDYATGKITVDLNHYKNSRIVPSATAATATNRADYVDCNVSYIELSYSVQAISSWPKTAYLGQADSGYVQEGTNYVFAFIDVDASGSWGAGEPCGVATPFATDINWDYNRLNIQLTDYTPGYLRLSLASGLRSEDVINGLATTTSGSSGSSVSSLLQKRIRVRRTQADGSTVYSRTILEKVMENRTYLHEGDFLAQGDLAMDWGYVGVPTNTARVSFMYDVAVADATQATNTLTWTTVATFSNGVDSVREKAVSTSPIGGASVYSARPVFRWTMPDSYPAFAIEIKKGSSSGTTIYQSGPIQAPIKDMTTGEYVWEAPISAGSLLASGQLFTTDTLYVWRVIPLNARFTLTPAQAVSALPVKWTDWTYFRLSTGTGSGYGELRASVKYFGPATSNILNRVKVQVYRTAGFTGLPEAQHTLADGELVLLTNSVAAATNVVLRGLLPSASAGSYYVRAYIDYNTNGVRDAWESWGYANYYGLTSTPYTPRPFTVTTVPTTDFATIFIEDADTDHDWFPDAWEYEQHPSDDFLSQTQPSSSWDGTSNIQLSKVLAGSSSSATILMSLAMGTSDANGNGIGDMAELILGTSSASSTDGYTVADKYSLGLAATDFLALQVTGIDATDVAPKLSWSLGVTKDASVNRTTLSTITGVSSTGLVTYTIEYTPSLLTTDWQTVGSGSVELNGTQTLESQLPAIDSSKGFFRIRLSK